MLQLAWLIPLLPLIGFLINGIGYKSLPKSVASIVGSSVILGAFTIVVSLFIGLLNGSIAPTVIPLYDFITVGDFNITFSFQIDQLSVFMMLIITGVGFLIHLYSAGYMHDDEGFNKFFAYLNLFVFFMLLLVMGSNYIIMFIGWEGVGLCSYLLIGFWFSNDSYNDAAKKAFIMNRIGDLGFLLGVFLIIITFGSTEFSQVFALAKEYEIDNKGTTIITAISILLFIGATGKSAQIPLFTWLPDAMAGPTPVSALIHAATMVTAGIYMVARSGILYALSPVTMSIIAIVGIATALFAATIGLAQNDIKKVLAYSTVSQLGYMFLGLGVGSFTGALFHVMTHAFFKALLFLGAGSVIHAMSGEQDIRNMGALSKKLPITFITFLLGTIAIAGIPPFAGFFSKDEILAKAFEVNPIFWGLGVVGAMFTAFYMFRLLFLTFFGSFRGTHEQEHHLHESPLSMTVPLMILAGLSVVGGFFNVPEVLGGNAALANYFAPIFSDAQLIMTNEAHLLDHTTEYILMGTSVGLALASILTAYFIYVVKKTVPIADGQSLNPINQLIYNKYYIDEIYDTIIRKPLDQFSGFAFNIIEKSGIDRIVNEVGAGTIGAGKTIRHLQTGNIGFYIFAMVVGLVLIIGIGLFI
ncbi:MAG: NADH-quinone oxidoreductase subunit L [Bacteroidota bacterium]|nr:NADH-quinone oxidoreductase subunit L [Bacteroidota bacterium]